MKTRARIDEIYAKHTERDVEDVHKAMERDRFFNPEQAVEYGLIDAVLDRATNGAVRAGGSSRSGRPGSR